MAAVAVGAVTAAGHGLDPTAEGDGDGTKPLAFGGELATALIGTGGNAPAAGKLPVPEVLPLPQETLDSDVADLAKGEQIAEDRAEATREAEERAAAERAAAEAEATEQAAANGVSQLPVAVGDVVMPALGRLTSGFGLRWGTNHNGIDIANSIGTPIYATTDGVVVESGPASGFGMWVRVQHPDDTVSVYGHINESLVREGQRVAAGEQIATMGNRGQSTGPHLHFEIWKDGEQKINPMTWLRENGVLVGGL
ncbi:MAG: M23 family metallopeptidase [Actinomycetota bacterium]|nr:M23 family metallopeptidase [Actinomycetota bacterium]